MKSSLRTLDESDAESHLNEESIQDKSNKFRAIGGLIMLAFFVVVEFASTKYQTYIVVEKKSTNCGSNNILSCILVT